MSQAVHISPAGAYVTTLPLTTVAVSTTMPVFNTTATTAALDARSPLERTLDELVAAARNLAAAITGDDSWNDPT